VHPIGRIHHKEAAINQQEKRVQSPEQSFSAIEQYGASTSDKKNTTEAIK
jgi:hypothetical protein